MERRKRGFKKDVFAKLLANSAVREDQKKLLLLVCVLDKIRRRRMASVMGQWQWW